MYGMLPKGNIFDDKWNGAALAPKCAPRCLATELDVACHLPAMRLIAR